jgi:hypothetical protein
MPNPVLVAPPVNLEPTINLRHDPHLNRSVTVLVKEVAETEDHTLRTVSDSVAMSATLARVQQLRRFITGVYSDAKRPLAQAKKTMDVQQRALVDPLKAAEARLTALLLAFEATQVPVPAPEWEESGAIPEAVDPPAPTLVNGMGPRTNYRADVTDLKALILSVAARLMLEDQNAGPMTKVTQRWLSAYRPTPQATMSLLRENPTALNALARALKEDLSLPGVQPTRSTILVDRG